MTYTIDSRTLPEQFTAVVFGDVDRAKLAAWLPDAFATARAYLQRWGAGPVGKPYLRFTEGEVEAGYAATTPVGGEGDVEPSDLPAGLAAVTVHDGDDTTVDEAIAALESWVAAQGGTATGAAWEVFESEDATGAREVVLPYRLG